MMTPLPTQISGAAFLASRHRALLADSPRVGKTGAAIMAADAIGAKNITVVTTASGRAVWRKAFADWSVCERTIGLIGVDKKAVECDVQIMSWGAVTKFAKTRKDDLVIADEAHNVKTPTAKRTEATFGALYKGGDELLNANALIQPLNRVWFLTGTPAPHDPGDLWCMLRAGCPERLLAVNGWPNVLTYDDFRSRYCVIVQKKISAWTRIPVVVGGKNLDELKARIGDFMLRRTQEDIGIRPPAYETLPLIVSPSDRRACDGDLKKQVILDAIDKGQTHKLDMELGPLKRLTGVIKAHAVVQAVRDEFDGGLDKLVLMYWHREVGDILHQELQSFGVARLDGDSSPRDREWAQTIFNDKDSARVFLGQIQAAGEAIDLSTASELWFVETSFTPAHMAQAALRITNINQKRNTFVKVCCIEGSIDEALQASLMRLWVAINTVVK